MMVNKRLEIVEDLISKFEGLRMKMITLNPNKDQMN